MIRDGGGFSVVPQAVRQAFRGQPLGELGTDGSSMEIVLSSGDAPADTAEIEQLMLPTATGPIPLSDIAEVEHVDGPSRLSRVDGERSATVEANVDADDLSAVTADLEERLDRLALPADVEYSVGGVADDQREGFADLGLAMLIAIAVVFMIMVATFRSLIQPLILLVSIPFAATGAIGLLLITDSALGISALIGMLMLIGIVVTNAIVLIDLINQYRDQGMSVTDAVVEGGRHRLRPIVMTALATIGALTPMALGITGEEGFIAQSLAIVVIGGLFSSTVLTLLLVPTLYVMVERAKERLRRNRRPTTSPAESLQD